MTDKPPPIERGGAVYNDEARERFPLQAFLMEDLQETLGARALMLVIVTDSPEGDGFVHIQGGFLGDDLTVAHMQSMVNYAAMRVEMERLRLIDQIVPTPDTGKSK